ncbi:SMI1/KNR4 family protein [Nocardia sp. NPDC058176]|uniref:SMI1/KNR4 family protein n=1 Tax=Nocardia sp. NPDC058176 TaxID=3346368 RepID=UPI0036DD565D
MNKLDTVLATFWEPGEDAPEPATDTLISSAEQTLGMRLPTLMCRLLREQNGGRVSDQWNAFRLPDPAWDEDWASLSELMGIDPDTELSILETPYLTQEWDLPAQLVLLDGDGHRWLALDYRDCGPQGEPSVAYFETDTGTSQPVAPDFGRFLESLCPESTFNDEIDPTG